MHVRDPRSRAPALLERKFLDLASDLHGDRRFTNSAIKLAKQYQVSQKCKSGCPTTTTTTDDLVAEPFLDATIERFKQSEITVSGIPIQFLPDPLKRTYATLVQIAFVMRTVPDIMKKTEVYDFTESLQHPGYRDIVISTDDSFLFIVREVATALGSAVNAEGNGLFGQYGKSINDRGGFKSDYGTDGLPPLWPRAPQWPKNNAVKHHVLSLLNSDDGKGFGEMMEELIEVALLQYSADDMRMSKHGCQCASCGTKDVPSRCMCGAVFCSRSCLESAWSEHTRECGMISSMSYAGHIMTKLEMFASLGEEEFAEAMGRSGT